MVFDALTAALDAMFAAKPGTAPEMVGCAELLLVAVLALASLPPCIPSRRFRDGLASMVELNFVEVVGGIIDVTSGEFRDECGVERSSAMEASNSVAVENPRWSLTLLSASAATLNVDSAEPCLLNFPTALEAMPGDVFKLAGNVTPLLLR